MGGRKTKGLAKQRQNHVNHILKHGGSGTMIHECPDTFLATL